MLLGRDTLLGAPVLLSSATCRLVGNLHQLQAQVALAGFSKGLAGWKRKASSASFHKGVRLWRRVYQPQYPLSIGSRSWEFIYPVIRYCRLTFPKTWNAKYSKIWDCLSNSSGKFHTIKLSNMESPQAVPPGRMHTTHNCMRNIKKVYGFKERLGFYWKDFIM